MSGKRIKWLILLLPLIVITAADGAPTISDCNSNVVNCSQSISAGAHLPLVPEISQITIPCDYQLAGIAEEFLEQPTGFADSPLTSPIHAKPLPAVPAASFMALIGFICVSLVKDRRVWLAALTGLLWVGQTGIQTIPQLVLRLSHANLSNKQSSAEIDYSNYLLNSNRRRSDIEGTRYIGLLHRLAGIPDSTNLLQPQSAFLSEQYSSNMLLTCLAPKAEQLICFSPAFIFCQLPRGPPILA